jgi:tetratricopeptide (TPR) repeat protein
MLQLLYFLQNGIQLAGLIATRNMTSMRSQQLTMRNTDFFLYVLVLISLCLCGCAASRFQNIGLYMRQQNWQKAQQELESAIRENPMDGKAHLLLAEVYGERGEIEKMLNTLSSLETFSTGQEKNIAYFKKKYWIKSIELGEQAMMDKESSAAVIFFQSAVLIDSMNLDCRQKYADALYLTGRYIEARDEYLKVLAQRPDDLVLKNNLAQTYFAEKRYKEVVGLCDEIISFDPHNLNALMRRVYAFDALSMLEEAKREYQFLARLNPSGQLFTDFGLLYFRVADYNNAITWFNKALALSSNEYLLYRYLGEANWRIRNYKLMAQWYQKVVEAFPDDIVGWKNLALAYEALGQKERLAQVRQHINDIASTN